MDKPPPVTLKKKEIVGKVAIMTVLADGGLGDICSTRQIKPSKITQFMKFKHKFLIDFLQPFTVRDELLYVYNF